MRCLHLDGDVGALADYPIVIPETDPGPSKRKPLPDHPPREEILFDVPSELVHAVAGAIHRIIESEMLD